MSNLLDKYVDTTDETAVPASDSVSKAKQRTWFEKKELRAIKALAKALRQRNKLLKQELELRKAETATVEANTDEGKKSQKRKDNEDSKEKGFLASLGKEIGKALPKVIVAVVTGVLGFFFKHKSSGKALQAA